MGSQTFWMTDGALPLGRAIVNPWRLAFNVPKCSLVSNVDWYVESLCFWSYTDALKGAVVVLTLDGVPLLREGMTVGAFYGGRWSLPVPLLVPKGKKFSWVVTPGVQVSVSPKLAVPSDLAQIDATWEE